jgi:hypothetical protein
MASKLNFCPFRNLPERGTPGHLYFVKDTPTGPELFLASRDRVLCPVTEFFNIHVTEAPGAPGRDGKDGRDGVDGKDGAPGPKGERGDVCYIGPAEVEAEIKKVRQTLLEYRAAVIGRLRQHVADHSGENSGGVQRLLHLHYTNLLKEIESL